MIISKVYVRFYKAFKYDYLRKSHENFKPFPWDKIGEGNVFPFVKVPLERGITTIVGANESGKSQLLSAIICALTGDNIERGDFCRYSQFFAVNRSMAYPEFGLEFSELTPPEHDAIVNACSARPPAGFEKFTLFRKDRTSFAAYFPTGDEWVELKVSDTQALQDILPLPFVIDANVPLPSSVPVSYLASGNLDDVGHNRSERTNLFGSLLEHQNWFSTPDSVTSAATEISATFSAASSDPPRAEMQLADDLLIKVAKVDRSAFHELLRAIRKGKEGFANGIIEMINRELSKSLDFSRWWSQDSDFELLVTLRDYDLVLTVRDKTKTEYSFQERSGGLKYFLSYFVQYLSHQPPKSGASEVVLMDEPDAYLSSMGQQDLLKILDSFAYPTDSNRPACQVVYVTHSPFLIDKNHGERIRVLEKGEEGEGSRVVGNVVRNHYEPLRSAFGSFVGETTFISNCNLMLEGASDQVILAGMSSFLRRSGVSSDDLIDLNTVTLVPAGSAAQVPYLVYLARGRDAERPAVMVLLDSDKSGNDAKRELDRNGGVGRKRISEELVFQVGDLRKSGEVSFTGSSKDATIENLIPLNTLKLATIRYVKEYLGSESAQKLADSDPEISPDAKSHDALEDWAKRVLDDNRFHLDKVGLARSIVEVLGEGKAREQDKVIVSQNFTQLFKQLRKMQRKALRIAEDEQVSGRIKRSRRTFQKDHPSYASSEECVVLLEKIETFVGPSLDFDSLRDEIRSIRHRFIDENNLDAPINDYDGFLAAIESLSLLELRKAQDVEKQTMGESHPVEQ
jgi:predicted ATP-dependent endonuclease of OLD family